MAISKLMKRIIVLCPESEDHDSLCSGEYRSKAAGEKVGEPDQDIPPSTAMLP